MKRVRMDEAARAVSTSPIMVGEVRVQPLTDGISEQIHVAVVAFRDGSHSMFTDRLGAGGRDLNPLVKAATIDLTLAFFEEILGGTNGLLARRSVGYENLLARFESEPRLVP